MARVSFHSFLFCDMAWLDKGRNLFLFLFIVERGLLANDVYWKDSGCLKMLKKLLYFLRLLFNIPSCYQILSLTSQTTPNLHKSCVYMYTYRLHSNNKSNFMPRLLFYSSFLPFSFFPSFYCSFINITLYNLSMSLMLIVSCKISKNNLHEFSLVMKW